MTFPLSELFFTLRPKQWTKNLFLFAGLLFSQNILESSLLLKTVYAFLTFCLISGCVYIINDICDLEKDRCHPEKSQRPLASGRLRVYHAVLWFVCLILFSAWISYHLNIYFFWVALSYFSLQICYSFILKNIIIIDVFSIALGFVFRVVAGAVVINVEISSWLLICTILLALFLGFSKRRHELVVFEDDPSKQRVVLKEYSPYLLDQMIAVVTASTVVTYALYTMSEKTIMKFGTDKLIFTVPFVLYGVFRYLYLIHQKGKGGNPENILISDKPLLINIFLWILTVLIILY